MIADIKGNEKWSAPDMKIRRDGEMVAALGAIYSSGRLNELLDDANRGAMTREAARSVTLSEYEGKSDCYYAWRQLQDAGAWVWDTDEMPENDPSRFEIMHAIQQAMGLLARRFTDKDLSLATEAREGA